MSISASFALFTIALANGCSLNFSHEAVSLSKSKSVRSSFTEITSETSKLP